MIKHLGTSVLSLGVLLMGCGPMQPADPELACDATAASVTLAARVQAEVFTPKCASCHIANYAYGDYTEATKTAAATVNKTSLYAGMAGSMKVVDPKNLANSSLWLKVLGGAAAKRNGPKGENTLGVMPNDGTSLTAAQKQLLKDWICTGAQ